MPPEKSKRVRFGPFEADLRSGELHRDGTQIHLQGQPFHVLAVLLERAGELVTREELRREVWPSNTFLEFDHALNTAIKKIRIALSDDAVTPCYVQTFPKRGYRWIAKVSYADPEPPVLPTKPPTQWRTKLRDFALGAFVASLVAFSTQRAPAPKPASTPTIAVEPVKNETDDSSLNLLCEGLTLHIAGRIVQSEVAARVGVADAFSSFSVKTGLRKDLQQLRVETELIRNSDRASLWHGVFEHKPVDSLQVEADLSREISENVLRALKATYPSAALSDARPASGQAQPAVQ